MRSTFEPDDGGWRRQFLLNQRIQIIVLLAIFGALFFIARRLPF